MCSEEIDLVWRIQWSATISGNMDFQACPGTGTSGKYIRICTYFSVKGVVICRFCPKTVQPRWRVEQHSEH